MNIPSPNELKSSSQANPVAFFESFYTKKGIALVRSLFIPPNIEDDSEFHYDQKEDILIKYYQDDNSPETIISKIHFTKFLRDKLYKELEISKDLINDELPNIPTDTEKFSYLRLILIKFKDCQKQSDKFGWSEVYDFILYPINSLSKYICEKYGDYLKIGELTHAHKIDLKPALNSEVQERTTSDIVEKIFGHIAENNFLASEEYNRLLISIRYLIANNSIPSNIEVFNVNILSSKSLSYSFYLLYRACRPNMKKSIFVEFVQLTFPSMFGNWEFKNLNSKFSEKPKKYPS